MRFETWSKSIATLEVDCLVVGVFEDSELSSEARLIDQASGGRLAKLLARGDFPGRAGETLLLADLPGLAADRVLLTGLGARKSFGRKPWRKACAAAIAALMRTGVKSAAVALERPDAGVLDDYYYGRAVAELTGAALYRINDLKSGKKPKPAALAKVLAGPAAGAAARAVARGLAHGEAIAQAAAVQRDLGNLPGNICTPRYLAEQARGLGRRHRTLAVRVLDEPALRREKMGCLLAVAQGSSEPPRLIVLEHKGGRRGAAPVVLVGKGVTFDSGGISLKPGAEMDEMKYDMSGAAAVLAALSFAAAVKLPLNVVGIVGAVENMPDGKAIKPGDIVTSASGQFRAFGGGSAVVYAQRVEPNGTLGNVFIERTRGPVVEVALANQARHTVSADGKTQTIELYHGERFEGVPGSARFRIMRFAEHTVPIPMPPANTVVTDLDAAPTAALYASPEPRQQAKLQWRIALPLMCLVLAIVALPLSRLQPRQGRYARVWIALVIYVVYLNLLTAGESWLGHGRIPLPLGLWWVHGLVLLLALLIVRGPDVAQRVQLRWAHT